MHWRSWPSSCCCARSRVAAFGALGDVLEGDEHAWQTADETGVPQPDMQDWTTLVDLEGDWAFRIGDAEVWATGYDDAGWDTLAVPGIWEDQGYQGYDGTAWYRRTFVLDADAAKSAATEPLYLLLGKIDDSDEAFVNGVRIGRTGLFPPVYKTGYYDYRVYAVPPEILAPGENTIAVRVYDGGSRGRHHGRADRARHDAASQPDRPRLRRGLGRHVAVRSGRRPRLVSPRPRGRGLGHDSGTRASGSARATAATTGSRGTARRSRSPTPTRAETSSWSWVPSTTSTRRSSMATLVGQTGDIEAGIIEGDEWLVERAYPLEAGVLVPGDNVIAVRVYDGPNEGGIHQGPVGLMTPPGVRGSVPVTSGDRTVAGRDERSRAGDNYKGRSPESGSHQPTPP